MIWKQHKAFEKQYYLCPTPFPNQGWHRGRDKRNRGNLRYYPRATSMPFRHEEIQDECKNISCPSHFSLLPAGSPWSCHSPSPRRGCTTGPAPTSRDTGTARTRTSCSVSPQCPAAQQPVPKGWGWQQLCPCPFCWHPGQAVPAAKMTLHSRQQKSEQESFFLLPSSENATSTS